MSTSPLVLQTGALNEARSRSRTPQSTSHKHGLPPTGPLQLPAQEHMVQLARKTLRQQCTPGTSPNSMLKRGYFAWNDIASCPTTAPCVDYLHCAKSCPSCGAGPRLLTWVSFMSPEPTWQAHCGTAGILTLCHLCQMQIDYFEGFRS